VATEKTKRAGFFRRQFFSEPTIRVLDLIPQLRSYADHERVWIRKRCVPLTAEQSERLTAFALRQECRRFALLRVVGQLTPFRSRGALRTWVVGGPHYERRSYFCAELIVEACVAAGLIEPANARPAATYPLDLFVPVSPNPFLARHMDLSAGWHPPARWTECPILLAPPDQ